MMYLRHEAGHAFNHAYELLSHATSGASCSAPCAVRIATTIRSSPSRATTSATSPAGTRRNIPTKTSPRRSRSGSTPSRTGATRYAGWGAMRKLRVRRPHRARARRRAAAARAGQTDITIDEMEQTVEEMLPRVPRRRVADRRRPRARRRPARHLPARRGEGDALRGGAAARAPARHRRQSELLDRRAAHARAHARHRHRAAARRAASSSPCASAAGSRWSS